MGAALEDIKVQAFNLSTLRNRLPRQVQRSLPLYAVCLVAFLFLIFHSFGGPQGYTPSKEPVKSYRDKFPKKIWQTWKVDPLGFEKRDLSVARTWTKQNPGFRYEVLTDDNDLYYVEQHFGPDGINRPDIVDMYRQLTLKIIKADLLRYLVMYAEGGVYTDIDVEALQPVENFINRDRFKEEEIDMVIGIEIDQPNFEDHPILGSKSKSFCQWTFMAKPRVPVMLHLVDHILEWLKSVAREQRRPIAEIELDFDEVISGTGPSAFTNVILDYMSKQVGQKVTWDWFHGMSERKQVGNILVLTVEAFAAGQGHSNSGTHNSRGALVKHRYHASGWPTKHARYRHPVYGEVERCNWNVECVKRWDANTANFEKLSEAQKKKMIEQKQISDALEEQKRLERAAEDARTQSFFAQAQAAEKAAAAQKAADDAKKALGQKTSQPSPSAARSSAA